jgi:dihydrofolate synthase / folylpolyglutamate synthase
MDNTECKDKFRTYLKFKEMERFLESLVYSKPTPHFVQSRHKLNKKKHPFGLERVGSFLNAIGNPHHNNKYIHITGTSGKTSTTYFMSNVLYGQGYKTGMHISPHICTLLERFTVDMDNPPAKDIINTIDKLKPVINTEYMNNDFGWISYFEFVLSAALKYFSDIQTDYVVLEVGLGGRYDATNIIPESEVSIITNIGLDHTHILGDTKEEIAGDKIGILKPGSPLVTSEKDQSILNIFKEEAEKTDSPVYIMGKDYQVENVVVKGNKTIYDYKSPMNSFNQIILQSNGKYQAENSSLTLRALELLSEKKGIKINEEKLRNSLFNTMIPARFELIQREPDVILDGAHNPDKIQSLVNHIKTIYHKGDIIFICGFTSGRKPMDSLKLLLDLGCKLYLTRVFTGYREDEEPKYLEEQIRKINKDIDVEVHFDPNDALDKAMVEAKNWSKTICATGSLYLVSYLRQRWVSEFDEIIK